MWVKRTIACLLLVALLAGHITPPASAAGWQTVDIFGLLGDAYEAAGSAIRDFYDSTIGAFLDGISGKPTPEEMSDAYDDYVTDVNDKLGTAVVGKDGYILPLTGYVTSNYGYGLYSYPAYSYVTSISSGITYSIGILILNTTLSGYKFPYNGYITPLIDFIPNGCSVTTFGGVVSVTGGYVKFEKGNRVPVAAGSGLSDYSTLSAILSVTPNEFFTLKYRAAYLYEPYTYSPNDYTAPVGGSGSRIGNVNINYGVISDDTLTVIENTHIVDETNNIYYNPVTDNSQTITNWTYDYSSRTYIVTIDNSQTIEVKYGDQHITINEGDTVYNVYYVTDGTGSGGPGTDPTEPGEPGPGGAFWKDISDKAKVAMQNIVGFLKSVPGFWRDVVSFIGDFLDVLPDEGKVMLGFITVGVGLLVATGILKAFVF